MENTVSEKPILFSGPMICAILAERKCQTRRVIKPQPVQQADGTWHVKSRPDSGYNLETTMREFLPLYCPDFAVGGRVGVRESHWQYGQWETNFSNRAGKKRKKRWVIYDKSLSCIGYGDYKPLLQLDLDGTHIWRRVPGIHMPKWASRLTLEVCSVRVERVQDISEADAIAEGAEGVHIYEGDEDFDDCDPCNGSLVDYKKGFQRLWDSINEKRGFGWDVNPWVFVIEFRRVAPDAAPSPGPTQKG